MTITGKGIIELVDSALEDKGSISLEKIAEESPNYLMVWVEHANVQKKILNLKTEKIVLAMAYLLSQKS